MARGCEDRWSDIDLFLGVGAGTGRELLDDWTAWLYTDFGAVHHFDVIAGAVTYRAFLLHDGLEVDLGVTQADTFGPLGNGAFDVIFGHPAPRQEVQPDTDHLIGLGWHHVLHARIAIAREAWWQAEYWISALRHHTISLACIRQGLPAHHGKGAEQLPATDREHLTAALVARLDSAELARALTAAVRCFLIRAPSHRRRCR